MVRPKIFVTREIPEIGLKIVKDCFDVEVWPEYAPPSQELFIQKARSVEGLLTLLSDKIDGDVFASAPKLKIVAQMAVGYDNIDVLEATKRGIYVTNTPGVLTETTADMAWAMLMARIFEFLPLLCPRCGHEMKMVGFIVESENVRKVLEHLELPTEAPMPHPPRAPPQMEMEFIDEFVDWAE